MKESKFNFQKHRAETPATETDYQTVLLVLILGLACLVVSSLL